MLSCKCDGVFQTQVYMPPLLHYALTTCFILSYEICHLNEGVNPVLLDAVKLVTC